MVELACSIMNITPAEALWLEPISRLGWVLAAHAKRNGVKGVGHQPDYKAALAAVRAKVQDKLCQDSGNI